MSSTYGSASVVLPEAGSPGTDVHSAARGDPAWRQDDDGRESRNEGGRGRGHRDTGFAWAQVRDALPGALRKLDPRCQWHNPVMLIVWVGAAFATVLAVGEVFGLVSTNTTTVPPAFTPLIAGWLWLTVVFANLAESIAEGRGKAQAESLRATRTSTLAHRLAAYDALSDPGATATPYDDVSSADLGLDDIVVVGTGELIPGDGDIVWGVASIDESPITGESAPVIRESGGDRSAVTGGTRVLSDRIVVRITSRPGETFVDRMIALVEGAARQRTPNEIALTILLAALAIVFVVVVLTLNPIAAYPARAVNLAVLIALLVCLIPTTIGALLSAIGIAGMDRLVQHNVLAMSGRAVEAAGDVTTLLLDKTGTITYGNRRAVEFIPLAGVNEEELVRAAALSSQADPTPEGVSIVELAESWETVPCHPGPEAQDLRLAPLSSTSVRGTRMRDGGDPDASRQDDSTWCRGPEGGVGRDDSTLPVIPAEAGIPGTGLWTGPQGPAGDPDFRQDDGREGRDDGGVGRGHIPGTIVPFTAQTRMSGLDLPDGSAVRKGAGSAVRAWVEETGGPLPADVAADLEKHVSSVSQSGGTPLVVAIRDTASRARVLGVVHLKDVVKDGLTARFAELRTMGIRTVMITGDNPLTAAHIAAEAGVDDYLAEATPEDKLALIRREQAGGHMVAMTGDGTNDAPALAQADVGVAMNTGTSAAKEAGNMVDLDSDPTKLIDVVGIGKQLLITRGALTTFSIANDVAKYFAIIPAMFVATFPGLAVLNIMHLHSPASAVLSAVIFNALVIIALIPLALRGVAYRPAPASRILARNLLVYGVGGVVTPFLGIWLIDWAVRLIPGF